VYLLIQYVLPSVKSISISNDVRVV